MPAHDATAPAASRQPAGPLQAREQKKIPVTRIAPFMTINYPLMATINPTL